MGLFINSKSIEIYREIEIRKMMNGGRFLCYTAGKRNPESKTLRDRYIWSVSSETLEGVKAKIDEKLMD